MISCQLQADVVLHYLACLSVDILVTDTLWLMLV